MDDQITSICLFIPLATISAMLRWGYCICRYVRFVKKLLSVCYKFRAIPTIFIAITVFIRVRYDLKCKTLLGSVFLLSHKYSHHLSHSVIWAHIYWGDISFGWAYVSLVRKMSCKKNTEKCQFCWKCQKGECKNNVIKIMCCYKNMFGISIKLFLRRSSG